MSMKRIVVIVIFATGSGASVWGPEAWHKGGAEFRSDHSVQTRNLGVASCAIESGQEDIEGTQEHKCDSRDDVMSQASPRLPLTFLGLIRGMYTTAVRCAPGIELSAAGQSPRVGNEVRLTRRLKRDQHVSLGIIRTCNSPSQGILGNLKQMEKRRRLQIGGQ